MKKIWFAKEAGVNSRATPSALIALDTKLLALMVEGNSNQQIAAKLRRPLSTVQRRTMQLFQSGIIANTYEIDYRQFGYKTGLLHVYLKDGDSHEMAERISKIESILDVSIHIGNSDLVAKYACKNTEALLNLLAEVKKTTAVTKIVWSKEVYHFPHLRKIVEIPPIYKRRLLDNQ